MLASMKQWGKCLLDFVQNAKICLPTPVKFGNEHVKKNTDIFLWF